jgi:hypothetical protein
LILWYFYCPDRKEICCVVACAHHAEFAGQQNFGSCRSVAAVIALVLQERRDAACRLWAELQVVLNLATKMFLFLVVAVVVVIVVVAAAVGVVVFYVVDAAFYVVVVVVFDDNYDVVVVVCRCDVIFFGCSFLCRCCCC